MIAITLPYLGGADNQQSHVPSWKRGVDIASPDVPSGGNGLEPLAVPSGGGGITVRPWWDILPANIPAVISRGLETPIISPVGAVSKTIFKIGGMAGFAALGGFILGGLFGGGGSQEQDITQEPEVTVTPVVTPIVTPTIAPTITPDIDTDIYAPGAGDINVTTYQNTITYNMQRTYTKTITPVITHTVTGASQEAKQEGGSNWIGIAIAALAAILILPKFFKTKKGR